MVPELGGSQISALLESVPGIASVLRSPVADAMVNLVRAGAGLGEFELADARELVQYAVRRGLISADEGDRLLEDVTAATRSMKAKGRGKKAGTAKGRSQKAKAPKRESRGKPPIKKTARTAKKPAAAKRSKRR